LEKDMVKVSFEECRKQWEKHDKDWKKFMRRLMNGEKLKLSELNLPDVRNCLIQNNILRNVNGKYVWNRPIVKKAMEKYLDEQKQD
jgi:hypothetical protein